MNSLKFAYLLEVKPGGDPLELKVILFQEIPGFSFFFNFTQVWYPSSYLPESGKYNFLESTQAILVSSLLLTGRILIFGTNILHLSKLSKKIFFSGKLHRDTPMFIDTFPVQSLKKINV